MGRMEARDLEILAEAKILRVWYPKRGDDGERGYRLAESGYLRAVRPPSQASGMPPTPVGYELTREGRALV
jgi:hypothetical protein